MANVNLTIDQVTPKPLALFHDEVTFLAMTDRQYDSQFAVGGAKIGLSLRVRLPAQPTAGFGKTATTQDHQEQFKEIAFDISKDQIHSQFEFGSAEQALELDDFSERVMKPAAAIIATKAEQKEIANCIREVDNMVLSGGGTGGALTGLDVLIANTYMTEQTCPTDGRKLLVNPIDEALYINENRNQFNMQKEIGNQYVKGYVGMANGDMWARSNHIPTIRIGEAIAGTLGASTPEGGNTLTLAGLGASQVIAAGTIITVAGVETVQVETKINLGRLKQFSVLNEVTADGSGNAVVEIHEVFTSASGGKENVTALPTSSAAFTIAGEADTTYRQQIVFVEKAFACVSADLELPTGGAVGKRSIMDGISMRINIGHDTAGDNSINRIDTLITSKTLRPEYAAKIWTKVA